MKGSESMYPYNGYSNGGYIPQYATQNAYNQRQEVVQVSGENGARAFNLPPNSSVLLLDNQNPIVYLKTTDGGGFPTITPYSITPYKTPSETAQASIEERLKRLEDIINESNFGKTEQQ